MVHTSGSSAWPASRPSTAHPLLSCRTPTTSAAAAPLRHPATSRAWHSRCCAAREATPGARPRQRPCHSATTGTRSLCVRLPTEGRCCAPRTEGTPPTSTPPTTTNEPTPKPPPRPLECCAAGVGWRTHHSHRARLAGRERRGRRRSALSLRLDASGAGDGDTRQPRGPTRRGEARVHVPELPPRTSPRRRLKAEWQESPHGLRM